MIPSLLTAIEEQTDTAPKQDLFQATVCLGWLHYVLDEPGLAVARLPKDFGEAANNMSGEGTTISGWSKVCLVKGTYLKGTTHHLQLHRHVPHMPSPANHAHRLCPREDWFCRRCSCNLLVHYPMALVLSSAC